MLTEQTIHNIKSTVDQTLMNLFNLSPDQLQDCEESELNLEQTSFFRLQYQVRKPHFSVLYSDDTKSSTHGSKIHHHHNHRPQT